MIREISVCVGQDLTLQYLTQYRVNRDRKKELFTSYTIFLLRNVDFSRILVEFSYNK